MQKRLILFDVDCTLIATLGAGVKALQEIVQRRYGKEDAFSDIEIAGRTDMAIATSILRKYHEEPNADNLRSFFQEYLSGLERSLPQLHGEVLPGIREILERIKSRPDRVLALLTGNLRRGAELKLRHYGLWHFFEFGAFADDHHDRNQLGRFARERAREKHGHEFDGAQIDVIGDTGHDIACGRAFGARTIAVATGSWSFERLQKCAPDYLFQNFSEVEHVMNTLGW